MRRISTILYQLGQGFIGVVRNGVMSLASLLVLVSCMLIIGTFYLIINNIDRNLKSTADINIISVNLPDELTDEQVDAVKKKIEKIGDEIGNVEEIKFHTKAENFEHYKKSESTRQKYLEIFTDNDNPIPRSFEIAFTKFSDPNFEMDKVYQLKQKLYEIEEIPDEDIKEDIELYDKVTSVNKTLTVVAAWMMVILLLVSLFVIMNTIKLGMFARRSEIMFMRYVGATKSFIRTPFIIEGIIIGMASAAAAFGLQYYIYDFVIKDILANNATVESASLIQLAPFNDYKMLLIYGFVGIGLFAGVISSSLSIKKYLKA